MSIAPILPGRLPNSYSFRRLNQQIQQGQLELQRLQDQLTTGQQYIVPSENPASALNAIVLQSRLERQQQFKANVQTDRSLLGATENALSTVSDAVNSAKSIILRGVGDIATEQERIGLATEVGGLIQQVLNTANTKFRGRYLFAGTETDSAPFELAGAGNVLYSGNAQQIGSFVNFGQQIVNNLDGQSAFNVLTTVESDDLNVALTLDTKLSQLHGGAGTETGSIDIVLQDGAAVVSRSVDLSLAETVGDVKTFIEDAFAGQPVTVTVDVDPASPSGLRLTPSSGTVSVSDVTGSRVAAHLGIASAATAQISGADVDPTISIHSQLSDLNNGTGIGVTAGTGLLIRNGDKSAVIDVSSAVTVQDLFNQLRLADLDLDVGVSADGAGLTIASRLAGAEFSIGENNGTVATSLGIRTLTGDTLLSDLNGGAGAQLQAAGILDITRRNGSSTSVDVSGAQTVQQVIDTINAVDPGNLTASLNAVGNGISVLDNSGTGPLAIAENDTSLALGIAGTESGADPSVALSGADVNPQKSDGLLSLLTSLEQALRIGDDAELTKLSAQVDAEADRFFQTLGELGVRTRTLEDVENRLLDEEVLITEDLSQQFDADLAEVLSNFVAQQQVLQATYQVAGQGFQLSLIQFL
jgi:flagellar hook-associated protein 3 FlgL